MNVSQFQSALYDTCLLDIMHYILTDFKNSPISSDPDIFQKCFNTSKTFKTYSKERQLYGSFRNCKNSGLFITLVCVFWI